MKKFSNRLLEILRKKELSASQFAERIGVQRSSVSHVLSGRNKPSLDFIIKISNTFTDISLKWLIHGEKSEISINNKKNDISSSESSEKINLEDKELKEIIFFYKDNSFKIFKNKLY